MSAAATSRTLARAARVRVISIPRHRLAMGAILLLSLALGLLQLDREGWANEYYAATVRTMLTSPANFFFGSLDGFITVDKPPVGFWIQAASAALLGFSGVSLLLPEVLAAVASVGLLYALVARPFGRLAGLLAALALAVTPISVATSRNNTIDSILVLFLLLAAGALLRSIESGRRRWLMVGVVLVGLGFNVKMLEAYLVVPALFAAYVLAGRGGIARRVADLAVAAAVLLAVSFSWAVAVDLIPADSRPFIGGSQTNSVVDLALDYNGLERLTGGMAFPDTGEPGLFRLVSDGLAGQLAWLVPLVLVGGALALWRTRFWRTWGLAPQRPWGLRRRRQFGSLVLWGIWLATAATFFSVARFWHLHYLVVLAPAAAALAGIGVGALWHAYRAGGPSGWLLPIALALTGLVQVRFLAAYDGWDWLQGLIAAVSLGVAVGLVVLRVGRVPGPTGGLGPVTSGAGAGRAGHVVGAGPVVALGVAVLLAAPTAWSTYTAFHPTSGNLPSGGPTAAHGALAFGPGRGFGNDGPVDARPGNVVPGNLGPGVLTPGVPTPGAPGFGGPDSIAADGALIDYLLANRGDAAFIVAAASSNETAPIIIATGQPAMTLGGFSGGDRTLTSAQFAARVAAGEVRFVLAGGTFRAGFGRSNEAITWATANCSSVAEFGGRLLDCATRP